jgi:hypothetical protein
MEEICRCSGQGSYDDGNGNMVPCICQIKKIILKYLEPFIGIRKPDAYIVNTIDTLLLKWKKSEETVNEEDKKIILNSTMQDYEKKALLKARKPIKIRKKWLLFEQFHEGVRQEFSKINVGRDYMSILFYYLYVTGEYISYHMLDTNQLLNLYYSYDEGVIEKHGGVGFYGLKCNTLILLCKKNHILNRELFKIISHFIDTYSDRNIIIYADKEFRYPMLMVRKTAGEPEVRENLYVDLIKRTEFSDIVCNVPKEKINQEQPKEHVVDVKTTSKKSS